VIQLKDGLVDQDISRDDKVPQSKPSIPGPKFPGGF
jgi:hypothetical protein